MSFLLILRPLLVCVSSPVFIDCHQETLVSLMIITVNINSLVRVLLRWGKDVVVSDWRSVSRRGHQQWWYHDNHNASQATFNLLLASTARPITAASHLGQPMGGRPSILHKWMLIIWAVIILRPDRNSNLPLQQASSPQPPNMQHDGTTLYHLTTLYHTRLKSATYNRWGGGIKFILSSGQEPSVTSIIMSPCRGEVREDGGWYKHKLNTPQYSHLFT